MDLVLRIIRIVFPLFIVLGCRRTIDIPPPPMLSVECKDAKYEGRRVTDTWCPYQEKK